jgi:soluble lytic murein transglycosylase-like protein
MQHLKRHAGQRLGNTGFTGHLRGARRVRATLAAVLIPLIIILAAPVSLGGTMDAGIISAAITLDPTTPNLFPEVGSLLAKGFWVDESLWYRIQNPMPKAHQKLLCEYSWRNGVPYLDVLALVGTESNFDEKCVALNKYYGYFQIGKGHFPDLAASLKTANDPLNGEVNIQWGTAMYGWILEGSPVKNLPPEAQRDAALSIYSRGPTGYAQKGLNQPYLARYAEQLAIVEAWYAPQPAMEVVAEPDAEPGTEPGTEPGEAQP